MSNLRPVHLINRKFDLKVNQSVTWSLSSLLLWMSQWCWKMFWSFTLWLYEYFSFSIILVRTCCILLEAYMLYPNILKEQYILSLQSSWEVFSFCTTLLILVSSNFLLVTFYFFCTCLFFSPKFISFAWHCRVWILLL